MKWLDKYPNGGTAPWNKPQPLVTGDIPQTYGIQKDINLLNPGAKEKEDKEKRDEYIKTVEDRKKRIAASKKVNSTKNILNMSPQDWATSAEAIPDELRGSVYPNAVDDSPLNPLKWLGEMASNLGQAPLQSQQQDSNIPYLQAAIEPILVGALGRIGETLPEIIQPIKKTANYLTKNTELDKQLVKIEKEGLDKGLSEWEIKKNQFEQTGITSNQRKAYIPIISDAVEKYVYPYGYTGNYQLSENKVVQTLKNIYRKEINPNYKMISSQGYSDMETFPDREDAFRLYLGKPQKNNTFSLANTSPSNHPSYTSEQLKDMDIYSINDLKNSKFNKQYYEDDDILSHMNLKNNMSSLTNKVSLDNHELMGGFNKRRTKLGTEYNDIWDLHPSFKGHKIHIENFLGKPFMSHDIVDYTSQNLTDDLRKAIPEKIKNFLGEGFKIEEPVITKYTKLLEELKDYPKQKNGGTIKNNWLNKYN